MGFVRLRDQAAAALEEGPLALMQAVIAWSRTRGDVIAAMLLPGDERDANSVIEILLLVHDRAAFDSDPLWHDAALGGRVAIGREDLCLSGVSSRLLRLGDGACVQFWIADTPPA